MKALARALAEHGLHPRGWTRLEAGERAACCPAARDDGLLLVGNIGSSYWTAFSRSAEFNDGAADPLDRWSRRVGADIAARFDLAPLFPFDGPPYLPFQRWAARAEGLKASPLGILIHPRYGLWHSWRFALAGVAAAPAADPAPSPCLECADQACMANCPADAVSAGGYDVERCAGWLDITPDGGCHVGGCLARLACPVAADLRYSPAQRRFHLAAFVSARRPGQL